MYQTEQLAIKRCQRQESTPAAAEIGLSNDRLSSYDSNQEKAKIITYSPDTQTLVHALQCNEVLDLFITVDLL